MSNKNSDSKIEANNRYGAKTYRKINLALRLEEDHDIIKSWETCTKELGYSNREWVRMMFDSWNEKDG